MQQLQLNEHFQAKTSKPQRMKFIPIIFSQAMVKAILEGRKTQTRREAKHQPKIDTGSGYVYVNEGYVFDIHNWKQPVMEQFCPYEPGDVLWVRENWAARNYDSLNGIYTIQYQATEDLKYVRLNKPVDVSLTSLGGKQKWRPSIHLPKQAARIFLKVVNRRLEQIQEITTIDAKAEGVKKHSDFGSTGYVLYTDQGKAYTDIDAVWSFESLWRSINGDDSWDKNPWVWVIQFERIEKPEGF